MNRIKRYRWKKAAILFLVLLLFAAGGALTAWYGAQERVRLTLPASENWDYEYAGTSYEALREENGSTVLLCSPGTSVTILLTGEKEPGRTSLTDENGQEFASFEGRKLSFEMPEKNLFLQTEEPGGEEETGTALESGEQETKAQETEAQETEEAGQDTELQTETEGISEPETETQTDPQSEPSEETGGEETEYETEAGTERETESGTESGTETVLTEETRPETVPETGSETESDAESETEPEELLTETGAELLTEAEEGETETEETETEAETETETEKSVMRMAAKAGSMTLNSGDFYYAPSGLRQGEACTVYKTVTYQENGKKVTKTAFCLQPYAMGPDDGHVYKKDDVVELGGGSAKNRNIQKALYYLYSGPAWGKTIGYEDGSGSVNLRDRMREAGCTGTEHDYCISHYVISYFYLGAQGKWNYARLEKGEVANVFNDRGVALITGLAEEIKKLPMPQTSLSQSSVTAAMDFERNVYRSASLIYQAPEGNTGTVSLPQGVTLVNETTKETKTGSAKLNGGDQFYLQVQAGSKSGEETYTIQTAVGVDFTVYRLEFAGRQDVGFASESGGTRLQFTVDWPKGANLVLQKVDGETGTALSYNGHYSLAGAVYGVYTDANCTREAARLTVGNDGKAQTFLTAGTYYLKELQAPKGYRLDGGTYPVTVGETGGTCTLKETPVKEKIRIRKKDAETGEERPQNSQCSFAGAEYTVYSDEACSSPVEVLVTDDSGTALSGELRLGTYYVKETKAPEGYLADTRVYPVTLGQEDEIEVYEVSSREQVIRGSLALVKYLDDNLDESILQDLYDSGKLEHIRFTLRHEDPQVEPVAIETDRYGYAATERGQLQYGTWYLTEDPATTPEGYEGIRDVKIEIREDGDEQIYVVTNKPYQAYLCIRKVDQDTGAAIIRSQAEFQIWDSEGSPVQMPTFDGYTDTFRTNEKGEIHLTRSLKGGRYTLVETKAPEGYLTAEPIPFEISENAVFDQPLTIVCRDTPQMGKIRIRKLDEDAKEPCGEGFVFQITVGEDITDGAGNLRVISVDGEEVQLKKGALVDELITDETGTAVSRNCIPEAMR